MAIVLVVDTTPSTISIENLRDGDEEQAFAISEQSFFSGRPFDPNAVVPANDRIVAAYRGDQLLGRLKILDSAQWFGGKSVPMGGIGGVVVAAEARGMGIAQRLLDEALQRMRADGPSGGAAISTLYPTTATLYRSRGYEFAGTYTRPSIAVAEADMGGAPAAVQVTWDDPRVRALYNQVAQRHDGWLDRTDYTWASVAQGFRKKKPPHFLYGIERGGPDGELIAVIGYSYASTETPLALFDIDVHMLFALDGGGLADALTFLSRNGTTAGDIALLYPADQLRLSVRHGQRVSQGEHLAWMTRLVDPEAAVAARGYVEGVDIEVHLNINDATVPANDGPHVLRIVAGVGSLEAGGRGAAAVDIGDFASLYTGFADAGFLATAGRLAGAEASDVDALRRAFAGPPPTIVDFF